MKSRLGIGFSQRIQLDWLEHTATLALTTSSRAEIQAALLDLLRDELSIGGTAKRGSREKTISILLKIWVEVPKHLEPVRQEALEHFRRLPESDHFPLHWGMSMATYPFFAIVAETVGRLLRLQETVSAPQFQRRIQERLGEREAVARAARRAIRSIIGWGAIKESGDKGVYTISPIQVIKDRKLAAWLAEAASIASESDTCSFKVLVQTPALFPFELSSLTSSDLIGNPRLELFRQGLDEEIVTRRSRQL